MCKEELKRIIENHRHWINEDVEGWEVMKADLGDANLRNADLGGANLGGANLENADLRDANLRGANLENADLRDANLRNADLVGANLEGANLVVADLGGANLGGANLRNADLRDADLRDANLRDAYLGGANLGGANLDNIVYNYCTAFFAMQCPEEGSFIGWKNVNGLIIKLMIPEDAKRSSATSRKCRCDHAEVLEIQNIDGTNSDVLEVVNKLYVATTYKVGDIVHADKWDADRWNESSSGIHFFITREEAVRY